MIRRSWTKLGPQAEPRAECLVGQTVPGKDTKSRMCRFILKRLGRSHGTVEGLLEQARRQTEADQLVKRFFFNLK